MALAPSSHIQSSDYRSLTTHPSSQASPIVQSQESHATIDQFHVYMKTNNKPNLQTKQEKNTPQLQPIYIRPSETTLMLASRRYLTPDMPAYKALRGLHKYRRSLVYRVAKTTILPVGVRSAAQERAQAFSAPRGSPWGRLEGWKAEGIGTVYPAWRFLRIWWLRELRGLRHV